MRVKPEAEQLPSPPEESDADPELSTILEAKGISNLANNPELQRVIRGAMDGTLPLDKPLEVNQPQKLSPRAIQTVLLGIGRYYTKREIADISGMNYVYVTKLMKHPYAQRILSIAEAAGVAEMSAIDRRLKKKSPKMLKIVENIAENERVDPPVRLRAAFGWLDRAGHNETKKSETKTQVSGSVLVTHERSRLIADAIKEAKDVKEADFTIEEPEEAEEERRAS